MDKIIYIDSEQLGEGAVSIALVGDGNCKVAYAGKSIESMSIIYKNEKIYKLLSDCFDVKFIFDDEIPEILFYPIPRLVIFAIDSIGGVFASINDSPSLEDENIPVYYIDNERNCFNIADNLKGFLELVVFYPKWKESIYSKNIEDEEKLIMNNEEKYLIDKLNLIRNKEEYGELRDRNNDVKLYDSYIEAKKWNEFYEIGNLD